MFDNIALDCKDFQTDDIYTCVLGNEILDVHGSFLYVGQCRVDLTYN